MKKKREEHGDSEVVLRFMRVLKALGPHADELVRRYKESSCIDLSEALARSRGLRHKDVDPWGMCSPVGLLWVLCLVAISAALFGIVVAMCCLAVGVALRFQARHQMDQFYLDRRHLTQAARLFELLEPCLRDKRGVTKDVVADHVDFVALMDGCGAEPESSLARIVDAASYFEFVPSSLGFHRERARRKIRQDQDRFGIPRQAERP
jgi:hypothetical protein